MIETMTVETYLHTSFENPNPEYWDGKIVRRTPADLTHSTTHVPLRAWPDGSPDAQNYRVGH